MEKYFEILSQCTLFNGMEHSELKHILECLGNKTMEVPKGCAVFLEGDPAHFIGVVLSGRVQIIQNDYYGKRNILTVLEPGEVFAEVFSCAGLETMPVSAITAKDSHILLLDVQRVLTTCSHACRFHSQLMKNLLQELAKKNLSMNKKIRYMSQKTTKEKLTAYLFDQAKQCSRLEFTIPCNRQELADYLGVERSAMSAEISKLKKAGLLDTKGSWFRINQ